MSNKYLYFRITIALLIISGFALAFLWKGGSAWMDPRSSADGLAVGAALSEDQIRHGIDAPSLLAPVLGTYPNTSVEAGGNVIVTPSGAPSGTTRINASANTNFKGTLVANPTTGIVRITNAHPAGTYVVTVTAFDGVGGVASGTFTLTVGNQSLCEPVQFTSAANVSTTGGGNLRVAVGDFNNDGNQDLAATNSTSGTVSVRLGNGSGGFSGSTEVGVGSGPQGITVGDFNNDGNQDIATANSATNTLSVRLGNGTGGFSGTTTLTVQDSPQIVVTADFNKDGNHDLAVTGLRDGAVSSVFVLLGNGIGGFGPPNDLFVGAGGNSGAFGLAPGDFNNNGKPDVAVANTLRDPGIVSLRMGDGLGGFGGFFEVTSIGLGNSIPRDIAIGDFNNDGNQDFATTSRRGVSGTGAQATVSVRLGNGAAGFTGSTELDVGSTGNLLSVATADFNKDGKQDIITTGVSGGSSAAFVRVGNGSGGFSGTFMTQVGNGADGVAIGDFNNDGRQDFVTATVENLLSVRLGSCNLGTGPSPTPTPIPVNPQPAILTTTETTNRIVVFPNAYTPDVQNLVPGLPAGARPFAVSFFDPDHALVSDFDGHRIYVVRISTASIVSTIEMSVTTPDPLTRYDGTGTLVVAPDRTRALAIGEDNLLHVINAPFDSNSVVTDLCMPGFVSSNATQAIVFDNTGRAFVHHSEGITVLDPPYASAAFTIPLPGGTGDSGIVISQDGNTLLTTIGLGSVAGNVARIFQAPFSAASTPTTLSIPNSFGASGIRIAPDGASAILLNFGRRQAFAVFAPFSVNSLVEEIPLPPGENLGFGDLDISADSRISILTRSGAQPANQAVSIRAPFGTASVSASVPVAGVVNPSSGLGSIRFMPRGLAAGLTVSGTAAPSVASGTNLTYTISYRNTGIVNASNVVIRNPIPAGTTFVSATNGGSLSGDRVVFNLGNVGANSATQTVSFTVNVTPLGSSPVTNSNYTIEGTGVAPIPGPPIETTITGLTPAPTPCARNEFSEHRTDRYSCRGAFGSLSFRNCRFRIDWNNHESDGNAKEHKSRVRYGGRRLVSWPRRTAAVVNVGCRRPT